ncbi:MAG TPA: helix-turn-helix transcriptional regulator [Steroidobacteraceae bacterium]|nr:helix-turn-helix transcriptional regulator [Steroidobacteraceae bacterium]
MMDDENWLSLADSFHAAAIDGQGWYDALASFAEATGSRHGQLVCMTDGGDALNLLTDVDPGLPGAFLAAGGNDPRINPRRRAGLARPPLAIIAESDFITPDAVRADAHYQEFAVPWDVPYICLTTLEQRKDLLVGLAVIRNRQQGHIDDAGKRVFATLAPQVRAAVRTSLALGDQRAAVIADTFEKLATPAFVCDAAGMVVRLSPQAEKLCAGGSGLTLRRGHLGARRAEDDAALGAAIRAASQRRAEQAPRTLTIHPAGTQGAITHLDVMPLPRRRLELRFDARVLVLARSASHDEERRAAVLRATYGLTPAEVEIAMALARGAKAQAIAQARGVSVGTVRVQIKSLLAKAGVNRQVELLARLAQL